MSKTQWPDLFPIVDTWLPGETLYSLASRHHLVSGNILAANTCEQLFGHSRLGCSHDLPGQLDEFVKRTGGGLGGPPTSPATVQFSRISFPIGLLPTR